MIIGVISDTHIPERASAVPAQALKAFAKVDMVIHAGDLVDIRVLDQLRAVCPDVRAVVGNMDAGGASDKLPTKLLLHLENHTIAVMHGWGPPKSLIDVLAREFKNEAPECIIFGHSHIPLNEVREGILFFNPGSATDTVFAPYLSYGILKVGKTIKGTIIKLNTYQRF